MRTLLVAVVVALGVGALFFALRPDPTASDAPRQRTFDLEIVGAEMEPGEVSVSEGDLVTLSVTSEEPIELHLHGYDIEEEVEPGEATQLAFEADLTGRFEIEDHGSEAVLGALVVRPR